jgi:hypothetical protein
MFPDTVSFSVGDVVPMPTLSLTLSTNNVFVSIVKFPLALILPATSNFAVGVIVPIPTLPDEVSLIISPF